LILLVVSLASLIVVQDQHQPCPYLPGQIARMPLRLPIGEVTAEATDRLLELGYRRSGDFVYRTQCPACQQCQPTRVDVDRFRQTRSMKRVWQRGERQLVCRFGQPVVDSGRIEMFNRHRSERGLGQNDSPVDGESYRSFLVESCCETVELSIYDGQQLIAVSVFDVGRISTSAVYTFFDPDAGKFSLGTYAVLKQIEWAKEYFRRFVYLGMYVADNRHLNYKARFRPQQRREGDQWVNYE